MTPSIDKLDIFRFAQCKHCLVPLIFILLCAQQGPALHPSFEMIIRGLLRDDHIVAMSFPIPRRGNPDESCLLLKLFNTAAPAVAHPRPESPYQLIDHGRQGPFVRNPPLNPLWHALLVALLPFLEITVPA